MAQVEAGCVVGVISFKRPEQLRRLLQSIGDNAEEAAGCPISSIIVVDNDPAKSAESVVHQFAEATPWAVQYVVEPAPGISAARNRLLAAAEGAKYIAMVDDDELVVGGWPSELVRVADKTLADMVGGPVRADLSAAPHAEWMSRPDMFGRQSPQDESEVQHVSTANCLLRMSLRKQLGPDVFDSRLGLSGGSDWHLSEKIRNSGGRLSFAAQAQTIEVFPSDRVSLGWIARRWRRSGTTAVMVQRLTYGPLSIRVAFELVFRRVGVRLVAGALICGTALFRPPPRLRLWQGVRQIMLGVGTIEGLLGRSPVSYGEHGFETND